jgi:uncharacterized protein
VKVVLDSNAFLVSIPKKSPYRPVFDAFIQGKYILNISNEVLNEYIEVITRFSNAIVAQNIAELLATKINVLKIEIYYRWNLINADPDDNKFVDLAVASDADLLVTNDSHFNVLRDISFPRIKVISIESFLETAKSL